MAALPLNLAHPRSQRQIVEPRDCITAARADRGRVVLTGLTSPADMAHMIARVIAVHGYDFTDAVAEILAADGLMNPDGTVTKAQAEDAQERHGDAVDRLAELLDAPVIRLDRRDAADLRDALTRATEPLSVVIPAAVPARESVHA